MDGSHVIFENEKIRIVKDTGMYDLQVVRIKRSERGEEIITVLISETEVIVMGSPKMELINHGGHPAIRVSKK
jgi:hypothetical protein